MKSGVLLPDRADEPIATLTLNDSGKFEDRWVNLQVAGDKCVFLRGIEQMYLPIAHAEGKFVARDEATLNRLDAGGQLVLRYTLEPGQKSEGAVPYPANPNGAQLNVAGLCDETGRVFGLMPHPERHIHPTHHPRWTREQRDRGDGLAVFECCSLLLITAALLFLRYLQIKRRILCRQLRGARVLRKEGLAEGQVGASDPVEGVDANVVFAAADSAALSCVVLAVQNARKSHRAISRGIKRDVLLGTGLPGIGHRA